MKILFISLLDIESIAQHGLYNDLLREFKKNGHELTVVSPNERRTKKKTRCFEEDGTKIIKVKIGNIQKTNYIEKGISTLLLSSQLTRAIKKYCRDMAFDMILYATPPVTIYSVIRKLKKATKAKTVLMLKDIWPQEMVDLGLISDKGLMYKYFKGLEEKMYSVSDWIGYTSPANKKYLVEDGVPENKLIYIANSVDVNYKHQDIALREDILKKYNISSDSIVFFYGGNLGKPQDIDFLISCLRSQINKKDRYFVICGQGTEYGKLLKFFEDEVPGNMLLLPYLPKKEYDEMIASCDVGMVFLDHRFTVPNCPTRFYVYMEYSKAILACTDEATDIKDDISAGNLGWWCKSDNTEAFMQAVNEACDEGKEALKERGKKARLYLEEHYSVEQTYDTIINSIE